MKCPQTRRRSRASHRFAGSLSTFCLCTSTGRIRRMVRALEGAPLKQYRVLLGGQFDVPRQPVRTLSRPAELFACGPSHPNCVPFLCTRRLHKIYKHVSGAQRRLFSFAPLPKTSLYSYGRMSVAIVGMQPCPITIDARIEEKDHSLLAPSTNTTYWSTENFDALCTLGGHPHCQHLSLVRALVTLMVNVL